MVDSYFSAHREISVSIFHCELTKRMSTVKILFYDHALEFPWDLPMYNIYSVRYGTKTVYYLYAQMKANLMEDKIKSARQTAILLILLLVFTFNLNSTFKANIEKYNVLWSFWIFEALKEDSKVIPKVEPDDSIYSYQDVKKNLSNLQQNSTASEILQTVGWTVDTLKKDSLLEVTLDWSYIDFRL